MKKLTLISFAILAILCLALPALGQSTTKNVTVTWNPSTTPNVTYNVYIATTAAAPCPATPTFSLVSSAPAGATSLVDPNRATGNVYCYVVTAVNPSGIESVLSNIFTLDLTRPNPPTITSVVAK